MRSPTLLSTLLLTFLTLTSILPKTYAVDCVSQRSTLMTNAQICPAGCYLSGTTALTGYKEEPESYIYTTCNTKYCDNCNDCGKDGSCCSKTQVQCGQTCTDHTGTRQIQTSFTYYDYMCDSCPAGKWSSSGSSSCTKCGKGKYNTAAKSTAETSCKNCAKGTFSNVEGKSEVCGNCLTGTATNAEGSTACSICARGKYNDGSTTTGRKTCDNCVAGKYIADDGAIKDYHDASGDCITCETGKAAGAGSWVCAICPAGTSAEAGQSSCTDCEKGSYSVEKARECTNCPAGKYAPNKKTANSCTPTPAGSYNKGSGNVGYTICSPGKYSSAGTSGSSTTDCALCPLGKYNNLDNTLLINHDSIDDCQSCTSGKKAGSQGKTSCDICAAGKWSGGAASECINCVNGKSTNGLSEQSSCSICDEGSYAPTEGSPSCILCGEGKINTGTALEDHLTEGNCIECDIDYIAETAGSTECVACESGKSTQGSKGESKCGNCGDGEEPMEPSGCKDCTGGKYGTVSTGSCVPCDLGKYNTVDRASSCNLCLAGTTSVVASDNTVKDCTACTPGKYASVPGSPSCLDCPAGAYSGETETKCSICPSGKTSVAGSAKEECINCPAGKSQWYDGAPLEGPLATMKAPVTICRDCEAGTYSEEGVAADGFIDEEGIRRGSSKCTPCIAGRYSGTGATLEECMECEEGKTSAEGSDSCYSLANEFDTCPIFDGDTQENKCHYLYAGHWKEYSQGEKAPFKGEMGQSSCKSWSLCGYDVLDESNDHYYVMCNECADGYLPIGTNTDKHFKEMQQSANWMENRTLNNACAVDTKPIGCYKKEDLNKCLDTKDADRDEDLIPESISYGVNCQYLYSGVWASKAVGDQNPFDAEGGGCASFSLCSFTQTYDMEENPLKDVYRIMCDSCLSEYAPGMLGITEDGVCVNGLDGAEARPSYCYSKNAGFINCPDIGASGGSSVDEKLTNQKCKYMYAGVWTTVEEGENSPFQDESCSNFELCDLSSKQKEEEWSFGGITKTISYIDTTYQVACTQCQSGFNPSRPVFTVGDNRLSSLNDCNDQERYPTKCYSHVAVPEKHDWSICPYSSDQKNVCHYWYNGDEEDPSKASWVEVEANDPSPWGEKCLYYKMCQGALHENENSNPSPSFFKNPDPWVEDHYYIVCTRCNDDENDPNGNWVGLNYGADMPTTETCTDQAKYIRTCVPKATAPPSPAPSIWVDPNPPPTEDDSGGGGGGTNDDETEPVENPTALEKTQLIMAEHVEATVGGLIGIFGLVGFCLLKKGCFCCRAHVEYEDYDDEEDDDWDPYKKDAKRGSDSTEGNPWDYDNPMHGSQGSQSEYSDYSDEGSYEGSGSEYSGSDDDNRY